MLKTIQSNSEKAVSARALGDSLFKNLERMKVNCDFLEKTANQRQTKPITARGVMVKQTLGGAVNITLPGVKLENKEMQEIQKKEIVIGNFATLLAEKNK